MLPHKYIIPAQPEVVHAVRRALRPWTARRAALNGAPLRVLVVDDHQDAALAITGDEFDGYVQKGRPPDELVALARLLAQ